MKVYLSGLNSVTNPLVVNEVMREKTSVLLSYLHYVKKNPAAIRTTWGSCDLFIDSGGFSIRTRGIHIPVDKYRDFLLSLRGNYSTCANLDTMDLEESIRHQRFLEKAGLKPIPVYHFGEWRDRNKRGIFDEWVKEYPYIGVSGKINSAYQDAYFDYIFSRSLPNKVKLHGFALTRTAILEKYPFYSVDSTSWKNTDRFGTYFIFKNGKLKQVMAGTRRVRMGQQKVGQLHHGNFLPKYNRMADAIREWRKWEHFMTQYWAKKGVVWQE